MLFTKIAKILKKRIYMDVLIRKIEPMYIKEIEKNEEQLSKKLGRNVSRNEYISR
ncbi:hypothetical protein [Senegalia massiliensis]|uniref:hypothetical protein n=1 Tax=Senegalia massiliensis TaxID=1720316 RepID=UPI0013EEF842|nr:hypothetical protein [Senegalia massiliensis]